MASAEIDPTTASGRFHLHRMLPRDPSEPGRTASPLELFFDLVFVVAVSIASSNLHHALSDGQFWHGVTSYLLVFFAIWWAWMNFTWFATSFATDDWLYRVLTVVQMAGVLVLAAGIQPAFDDGDFTLAVYGYVAMRVPMVLQWLRASRNAGPARRAALAYAWGIAAVQVAWVAWLLVPDGPAARLSWLALAAIDLTIPVFAERRGSTPWHPHHITERFGLFTLIVLGESLLASANAIVEARHDSGSFDELLPLAVLALVVTAGLWWIYFWPPHHESIGTLRQSIRYGYSHYVIFAAAAAFSAGIEVEIDALTDDSSLSDLAASLCVTVPVSVFMIATWWVTVRPYADRVVNTALPLAAVLVLVDPLIPVPFAITSLVLVAVVAVLVVRPPVSADSSA